MCIVLYYLCRIFSSKKYCIVVQKTYQLSQMNSHISKYSGLINNALTHVGKYIYLHPFFTTPAEIYKIMTL